MLYMLYSAAWFLLRYRTRRRCGDDTATVRRGHSSNPYGGSMASLFGFEKNSSTITARVLILLLSYDKSTYDEATSCRVYT